MLDPTYYTPGMAMGRRKNRARTPGLWIATNELPRTGGHPFYQRLNQVLETHAFDEFAEAQCAPFYADAVGRPSVTPGTYFRLLLVGYFEGIDSERGIAWRTADSLALRGFLGLGLDETPPEHSTISRTRRLIDVEADVTLETDSLRDPGTMRILKQLLTLVALTVLLTGCGGSSSSMTAPSPISGALGGEDVTAGETPTGAGIRLVVVTFDTTPLGDYSRAAFNADWPSRRWVDGLGTGRAEIVGGTLAYSGRSLRLKYPQGTYGSASQAIQSWIDLPGSYEELYLSYRVRFNDGFDFVRGGKLPGLLGGAGNIRRWKVAM